jgi:hypothetical protein
MNAAVSSAALTEQLLAMQMDDEADERPGTTMTRASSFRGSELGNESTARPGCPVLTRFSSVLPSFYLIISSSTNVGTQTTFDTALLTASPSAGTLNAVFCV